MAELNENDKRKIEANNRYWAKRANKVQQELTNKSVEETEKQLIKYYQKSMRTVIADFEDTFLKVMDAIEGGKEATPADLYKLDKYWKMQGQLKQVLQDLGDKQAALFSKKFESQWNQIYEALARKDDLFFGKANKEIAKQMINEIWCADGKSWSQRIWDNVNLLQETLNQNLIDCVITGKKTSQLKEILQESFNVSFNRADSVVRTEMAHIQTQAAKKRYEDYGLQEVEIWADKDERRCDVCGKLHKKRYPIGAQIPIPAHPNCRCCIVPVVK